jgi:hypothetical protein
MLREVHLFLGVCDCLCRAGARMVTGTEQLVKGGAAAVAGHVVPALAAQETKARGEWAPRALSGALGLLSGQSRLLRLQQAAGIRLGSLLGFPCGVEHWVCAEHLERGRPR